MKTFSFLVVSLVVSFGFASEPGKQVEPKHLPRKELAKEEADLSGYYTCKGQEAASKKAYTGIVVLTKKSDIYLIQWIVGGGANFSGIAIRQGDKLAASWAIQSDKGLVRGVNLYRIEVTADGPRLAGHWSSVPGPGVQQTENLMFLKKLDDDD